MKARGFTLVELLIAMTILLMLLMIGSLAYGSFSRYWNHEVGDYQSTFKAVKGVNIVTSTLRQIKPYVLWNSENVPFHFFEGGKSVVRAIVSSSVQSPGIPAVFELKVEKEDGVQILIYREALIKKLPLTSEAELPEFDYTVELLRGIDDLSFEFWGWQHYDIWREQWSKGLSESAQWFGYYSGKDTLIPPIKVRVKIEMNEQVTPLLIELKHFNEKQLQARFTGASA